MRCSLIVQAASKPTVRWLAVLNLQVSSGGGGVNKPKGGGGGDGAAGKNLNLKMKFACAQCWRDGLINEPDKTLKYCTAKARHTWAVIICL